MSWVGAIIVALALALWFDEREQERLRREQHRRDLLDALRKRD